MENPVALAISSNLTDIDQVLAAWMAATIEVAMTENVFYMLSILTSIGMDVNSQKILE
jgi:hypothetical protein